MKKNCLFYIFFDRICGRSPAHIFRICSVQNCLPQVKFLKLSIVYMGFETVYGGFETVCPEKDKQTAFYSPLVKTARRWRTLEIFAPLHRCTWLRLWRWQKQGWIYVQKNLKLSTLKSGYFETVCPDQPKNLQTVYQNFLKIVHQMFKQDQKHKSTFFK